LNDSNGVQQGEDEAVISTIDDGQALLQGRLPPQGAAQVGGLEARKLAFWPS